MTEIVCLNCDSQMDSSELFCSERCQQMASTIRYMRATKADGRVEREDVRLAIKTKVASVLGGGYPRKARALTEAKRREIFERDEGRCHLCGAEANAIDHIDGSAEDLNAPVNLQALCSECRKNVLQLSPDLDRCRARAS